MFLVMNTLLPVFGLILMGFVCRRTGCLGTSAASELNRMVIWLCLPALLFRVTATTTLEQVWHPDFILVVSLATLAVFASVVVWKRGSGRSLADASIDGLGGAYANTGYIGIPLCLFVLGEGGLEPALIATLIVVCVLFSMAIVCIEIGLQAGQTLLHAVQKVLLALLKNPLVVSPMLGGLWAVGGLGVSETADTFLVLLGDATVPCALVSLGAFLAHKQSGSARGALGLAVVKLVIHPLVTWVLAFYVFQLPILWANAALLLSALPTGTGPFMLAEYYGREASVVSRTILLSTVGSLFTLSLCLLWISQ